MTPRSSVRRFAGALGWLDRLRRRAAQLPPRSPWHRLLLCCLLAVACAAPALLARMPAEPGPERVDVAVVDSAVQRLPESQRVLPRLERVGVGTVVLGMRSLREVLKHDSLKLIDPKHINDTSVVPRAIAGDPRYAVIQGLPGDPGQLFVRTAAALRARYGDSVDVVRAPSHSGPVPYLRAPRTKALKDLAIDYDRRRLEVLARAGQRVVLALPSRVAAGRDWLEDEIAHAQQAVGAHAVLSLGELPLTERPEDLAEFQDFIDGRGLELVLSDFGTPGGATGYVDRLPGRVLVAHLVDLTGRDDPESLEVRARRAVKERGVGMIVLRPPPTHVTEQLDPDRVMTLASSMRTGWPGGAEAGRPDPLPAVEPPAVVRAGAFAAALLMVAAALAWCVRAGPRVRLPSAARWPSWLPGRRGYAGTTVRPNGWWVTGSLAVVGVVGGLGIFAGVTPAWKLFALLTGICGAALAVITGMAVETGRRRSAWGHRRPRPAAGGHARARRVGALMTAYAATVGVVVTTGAVLAALGARSAFLVGAETFGGVKVLLLAPPLLIAAYAGLMLIAGPGTDGVSGVLRRGSRRWRELDLNQLRGAWTRIRAGIRPWHIVVVLLAVVAAGYYLIRSDNSGLAPGFELALRDMLDEALYVRPRFKEILVGFPALVLAFWWPGRIGRWCWAILGAVGIAGTVDTFVHYPMPLWVSGLRTAYSAIGGLAIGLLAVAIARGVRRVSSDIRRGPRRSSKRAAGTGEESAGTGRAVPDGDDAVTAGKDANRSTAPHTSA